MLTAERLVAEALTAVAADASLWATCAPASVVSHGIGIVLGALAEKGEREYDALEAVVRACGRDVRRTCEERFYLYHYTQVPTSWRQLHTDSILTAACAAAVLSTTKRYPEAFWLDRIGELDLALVLSGAPGDGRRECVHGLIEALQRAAAASAPAEQPRAKRRRQGDSPINTAAAQPATGTLQSAGLLPTAAKRVRELPTPPSLTAFLRHCPAPAGGGEFGRPFVVRGFAHNWPALCGDARWEDGAALLRRAGPGRVVPVEKGGNYTAEDWGQEMMRFDVFLRRTGWLPEAAEERTPLYLAQHTLLTQFPWLANDMLVPDYVYACPPEPAYLRRVGGAHVGQLEDVITSMWIGPQGTVSPAHTDPYFNCYVQAVGRKRVWIAPPDADAAAMHAYGEEAAPAVHTLMHNTSQVDVFGARVPRRFREAVVPHAESTELGAGDLLFLPPYWWHGMRSETRSFSVSYWF